MAKQAGAYGTGVTITLHPRAAGQQFGARHPPPSTTRTNLWLDAPCLSAPRPVEASVSVGRYFVYAYGTANGGTIYTEGASGTDGALTMAN